MVAPPRYTDLDPPQLQLPLSAPPDSQQLLWPLMLEVLEPV
jgi:hypothetical protein